MGRRRSRSRSRSRSHDRERRDRRNDSKRSRDRKRSDRDKDSRRVDEKKSSSRTRKQQVREKSKERKKENEREKKKAAKSRSRSGGRSQVREADAIKGSAEQKQTQLEGQKQSDDKQTVPDWVRDLVEPQPQALGPQALAHNAGHRLVVIPQQYVSKVVGFQGCTVNEIQLATGSYIQLNQETRDKGYTIATITSTTPQGLDRAEAMITERISAGLATQSMYSRGHFGMGKGGRTQLGLS